MAQREIEGDGNGPAALSSSAHEAGSAGWLQRHGVPWWQAVAAVAAVLSAAVAVWATLTADFLAHPGWLAAQKADIILGPVFVGLYWVRVRPQSRFGPLLIAFGFICAVYILHSSTNPWLFGFGVLWEPVIAVGTLALILTFPNGRLDGLIAKLILLSFVAMGLLVVALVLMLPQLAPGGSISGCRAACPENAPAITSNVPLAVDLNEIVRIGAITVALATAALLLWRIVTGTPPQRRALAIGTPVALLFLLVQAIYLLPYALGVEPSSLDTFLQWTFAVARSLIWYGFLFALIAAQLFAGRALHRMIRQSLRRPSQSELEAMLRGPLSDPKLRLVFRDPKTGAWEEPLEPGPGESLTVVEGEGTTAVALVHDVQLNDDPELLQAAGAVALLAAENAELDAAWNDALDELRHSRSRIVRAGDDERRKLERNLHDGVQQRLVSVRIKLGLVAEGAGDVTRGELDGIGDGIDEVIDEVREVAHGLYPPVLADQGLLAALEAARRRAAVSVEVRADGLGRHPAELESAVYYCCLEAIQNATKHGGPGVHVLVALREETDELSFDVTDDGPGFDRSAMQEGAGLKNMRDRLGALDGHLAITTALGQGTTVSGVVPLRNDTGPQASLRSTPDRAASA